MSSLRGGQELILAARRWSALIESGVGGVEDIRRASDESHGLGIFVRSLIGLDRQAAKQSLAGFLAGSTLVANQIEFVNLVVDHLTQNGVMDRAASPTVRGSSRWLNWPCRVTVSLPAAGRAFAR